MKFALAPAVALITCISVSGRQAPTEFQNFSDRAVAVIITMIGEAGQRGAVTIDVNDLFIALIAEDQDARAPILFVADTPRGLLFPTGMTFPKAPQRAPFLPPKVAIDVLIRLDQILPRSTPIPTGKAGHNTSAALDRVLAAAQKLPSEFHQGEVKVNDASTGYKSEMRQGVVPLDLLAAALQEPCEGSQMLQQAGISREKVIQIILAGGDLENGSFHLEPDNAMAQTP
jgi:hypothetical protein